jgi:BASS family bile acid:Na+ symporter
MSAQSVIVLLLQASIVGTVLSYGLQATKEDALHLVRHPGLLLRSAIALFVAMPLVAVVIVEVFELPRATEIALVALAIAPIPPLLPKKEEKAGGEGAYALGLMVTMGLLSILLVPLQLALLGAYFDRDLDVSTRVVAKVIVVMIVLPLLVGMVVRALSPGLAARLGKPVALVSLALLVVTVGLIFHAVAPAVVKQLGNGTVVAIAAFIALGLLVGHLLAGAVPERRTVLALSTASRHPAIALAIAKTNFPNEPFLDATIVLYLIVVTLMAIPYVQWRRHRAARVRGAVG